jgi:hypothetical protein
VKFINKAKAVGGCPAAAKGASRCLIDRVPHDLENHIKFNTLGREFYCFRGAAFAANISRNLNHSNLLDPT